MAPSLEKKVVHLSKRSTDMKTVQSEIKVTQLQYFKEVSHNLELKKHFERIKAACEHESNQTHRLARKKGELESKCNNLAKHEEEVDITLRREQEDI